MAPPTNIDAVSATDLGTLIGSTPNTITQNCRDGVTNYELWFKYLAVTGDNVIGAFPFGDLTSYRPTTRLLYGTNPSSLTQITLGLNKAMQFAVTAGTTYYFRVTPNTVHPPPYPNPGDNTTLTLSIYRHLDEVVDTGALIINDDWFGSHTFLGGILSPTDGHVEAFVAIPGSERLDVCHTGRRLLIANVATAQTDLYDLSYTLLTTLPYNTGTMALANNRSNRLYIGTNASPATVITTDLDGTVIPPMVTLGSAGSSLFFTIAANNAGTILYYSGLSGVTPAVIGRWDLVNNVALSNLATAPDAFTTVSYSLMVLSDDTIVAVWGDAISYLHLVQYQPDGTTVHDHDISASYTDYSPRVCPCEDDLTAIWIWERYGSGNTSRFTKVRISDAAQLVQFSQVQFETGVYAETATATPLNYFGTSESCFFGALPAPISGTIAVTIAVSDETPPVSAATSLSVTGYVLPPRHLEALCRTIMTIAALSPDARQRVFNSLGVVLSGAKLQSYEASTSTPLPTYSDSALTVPNSNPQLADAGGLLGPIYLLPQAYKFELYDMNDILIWSQDQVFDVGELLQATITALQAEVTTNLGLTQSKVCTTQLTVNSSTTLANITGLTGFALTASGVYQFEIDLSCISTANCGIKVAFKYTTATMTALDAVGQGFTASAVAVQHTTTTTDQASLFAQTAAVISVRIVGRITVNVAGTLSIQAAQNASHSDTTAVYTGSSARFTKIS